MTQGLKTNALEASFSTQLFVATAVAMLMAEILSAIDKITEFRSRICPLLAAKVNHTSLKVANDVEYALDVGVSMSALRGGNELLASPYRQHPKVSDISVLPGPITKTAVASAYDYGARSIVGRFSDLVAVLSRAPIAFFVILKAAIVLMKRGGTPDRWGRIPSKLRGTVIGLCLVFLPVTAGAQNHVHKVNMVVWRGYEEACKAFGGFVEERGLPVEVKGANVERDWDALPQLCQEILAERLEFVVTWGTSVIVELIARISDFGWATDLGDIPAQFMMVADPFGPDLIASAEVSGRATVTGVHNRPPETTRVQIIKSYMDVTHIGVLENPAELNTRINTKSLRALGREQWFAASAIAYYLLPDNTTDISRVSNLMDALEAASAEAVYVGSSPAKLKHREAFTATAVARGLPVFTACAQIVQESHDQMSVSNSYANVGQLAETQAVKVFDQGRIRDDLAIASLDRFLVFLNTSEADDLGRYPSIRLINIAEIIGGREGS